VTNIAAQNDATICSGGFRIEIHPDELTVTRNRTAFQPKNKTALGIIWKVFIFIFIAFYALFSFLPTALKGGYAFLGIFAAMIGLPALWAYSQGSKNLHCTRDNLEVIQVARGKVRNKWAYPKDSVKRVGFAPVSYSRYGSTCGLIFRAQGKKVKTLVGLECPEAQIILQQLDRLGFDIVHDVAMPMVVEMALERRNSVFNQ